VFILLTLLLFCFKIIPYRLSGFIMYCSGLVFRSCASYSYCLRFLFIVCLWGSMILCPLIFWGYLFLWPVHPFDQSFFRDNFFNWGNLELGCDTFLFNFFGFGLFVWDGLGLVS